MLNIMIFCSAIIVGLDKRSPVLKISITGLTKDSFMKNLSFWRSAKGKG